MPPFKIYTYPKFGDYCVSFGIVSEFAKHYDKVECYTDRNLLNNEELYETNKRLYSGLKNVELIWQSYLEERDKADHAIGNTKHWYDTLFPWFQDPSLSLPYWFSENWIFDRQWYLNALVPYHLKWDNFYFERDLNKEKEVFYDVLGLKDGEEFIFLHEDPTRNIYLKKEYINPNIKLIEFYKLTEVNILDILYTVEKAKEVHTFNTGLLSFIDLMNIKHNNLNYHKYIRPEIWDQPGLRLNWNVLE
jgi:hypothetical protein